MKTTQYAVPAYYIINFAEYSSNLGRYDGIRYGEERFCFEKKQRRIMIGSYVLSAGYYEALFKSSESSSKIIKEFNEAFRDVDFMIAPVSPFAFKIEKK